MLISFNENSTMHYNNMNIPTPPSSHEDSRSPQYYNMDEDTTINNMFATNVERNAFYQTAQHVTGSAISNDGKPFLTIIEQPIDKFRFRYKSEMTGTHGSISGMSSEGTRKHTAPTVELCNYNKPAILRCSIYQCNSTGAEPQPHAHRLVKKHGKVEQDDPHDIEIEPQPRMQYAFYNMGIIHTARKYIVSELERKKMKLKKEEIARTERKPRELNTKETMEIKRLAENESKSINLNTVCLRFDAFDASTGILEPICPPVFSHGINNLKSALTGELKIVRMDHCTSPAVGGREIFILVERVTKKNIKIRFFELDDEEREIWHGYGKFSDLDVHHQYAIVFKTPEYRVRDITKPVTVYIQLERPSDGARSDPKEFRFIPSSNMYQPGAKRAKSSYSSAGSYDSSESFQHHRQTQSPLIPSVVRDLNTSLNNEQVTSSDLEKAYENVNSEEFNRMFSSVADMYIPDELGSALMCEMAQPETFTLRSKSTIDFGDNLAVSGPTGIAYAQWGDSETTIRLGAPQSYRSVAMDAPNNTLPSKLKAMALQTDDAQIQSNNEKITQRDIAELKNFINTKPSQERVISMLQFYLGVNNKTNALHTSIKLNNIPNTLFLLKLIFCWKQNNLLNILSSEGETPLHIATCQQNIEIVSILLCKADVTVGNRDLNTALHLAIETKANAVLIAKLLSTNEARDLIERKNQDGDTPLFLAIEKNNLEIVKLLVHRGADINKRHDKNGFTPLRLAIEKQHIGIIKFLLEQTNIDPFIGDFQDKTPYDAALKSDNVQLIEIVTNFMKMNNYEIEIKSEDVDEEMSDDEEYEEKFAIKLEQITKEELIDMYKRVTIFTPSCLDQIAAKLDKTKELSDLADLLDMGHLFRSGLCESPDSATKVLLKLALESNGNTVLQIRDHLETLNKMDIVDIMDNMVKAQFV